MFILKKRNDPMFIYLVRGEEYTIGRNKTNSLSLPTDNTVSKKHAIIRLTPVNHVLVKDNNSSNKTFINGKMIAPMKDEEMFVGSEISFGLKDSIFILQQEADIFVTSSGLSSDCKRNLKDTVDSLFGTIVIDWTDYCTHIVVEQIVLTVKVLSAIVSNQPIVTPNFFDDYVKCVKSNKPLPNVKNYAPKLIGMLINIEIDYDIDRHTLFNNKIFVFPDRPSFKKMRNVIKVAGGKPMICDQNQLSRKTLLTSSSMYIFVQTNEHSQTEDSYFNKCVQYLMKNNKRSIPIQEIATAIITNDCSTHCNTSFDKPAHIFGASPNQQDLGKVLAMETQSQMEVALQPVIAGPLIVPATFENDGLELIDEPTDIIVEINESNGGISCDSSSKRNGDILESNFIKKSKMNKEATSLLKENKFSSQTSAVNIALATSTTDFLKKPEQIYTSTQKETTPIKRKAEEMPDSSFRKKKAPKTNIKESSKIFEFSKTVTQSKNNLVQNPFALKANKPSENKDINSDILEPPTSHNQKKKYNFLPSSISEKTLEESMSNVVSSTRIEEEEELHKSFVSTSKNENFKMMEEKVNLSSISSIQMNYTKINDTSKWLSKDDILLSNLTKTMKIEDDAEKKEYECTIKMKVTVVSDDSLIVRKSLQDLSLNSVSQMNTTGVDYKKFVKVKPIHAQRIIIPRNNHKKVICTLRRLGDYVSSSSESEPEEVVPKQSTLFKASNRKVNGNESTKKKFSFAL